MRAAGCVINDYADRHVDGSVERTKNRPIPAGEISAKAALTVIFWPDGRGADLVLLTNQLTIILAFGGAAVAALYPFLKRFTHLPQIGLGIAWAWSTPMAFAAETNGLPIELWVVFARDSVLDHGL